jgi:hypothetical protein
MKQIFFRVKYPYNLGRRNTTTHENLPKPQKEIFIQDQFRHQTETN